MHIGIVEDSSKLAEFLKKGLEVSGHTIHLYESEQEATSILLEARFQNGALPITILILDSDSTSDMKTIHRIRQCINKDELPILLLHNANHSITTHDFCDIRALHKPITSDCLREAVEEVMASKG